MKKWIACLTAACMLLGLLPFAVFAQEFSDMPDNWATTALERAVKDGLINGYDGKIMPNDSLTRAQMAAIFCGSAVNQERIMSFHNLPPETWFSLPLLYMGRKKLSRFF